MNYIADFLTEDLVSLLCFVGITIIMLTTKNHFPKKVYRNTIIMYILTFMCSITSGVDSYIGGLENAGMTAVVIRRIMMGLTYSLKPFIIAYATMVIIDIKKRSKIILFSLATVNALIHMITPFTGGGAYISDDNVFGRGPLGYTVFVVSGLLVIQLLYASVRVIRKGKKGEGAILIYVVASSVLAAVADTIGDHTDYSTMVFSISVLLYYLYLSTTYAEYYEEKLVEAQKNELALSQIKPHFMYNVLSSIYYLCDHDPKKAKEAVNSFSIYLRNNLDSMRREQIVPFDDELKYTKNYLSLEKIRFGDDLDYSFDIDATDFTLPKFTIQPLCENAVKHGLSQKIGKGTLLISVKDKGDYYIVSVKDDGVGFDPSAKPDDGRSHTGIENINYRLNEFTGETLHVESKPNEGCYVWFKVNKNKDKE